VQLPLSSSQLLAVQEGKLNVDKSFEVFQKRSEIRNFI
jgi:hypothetical protein